MNILIKLSTIVALIIAPHIAKKTKVETFKETEIVSHQDHHHHNGQCCHRHDH